MESTIYASVAGGIRCYIANSAWAALQAGNGNGSSGGYDPTIGCDGGTDKFTQIARSFFIFDTSSLPNNATVTAATFSIYVTATQDFSSGSFNLYKATTAANDAIANSDYEGTVGNTTVYCDTAKNYTGLATSAYAEFTLNAAGITNISLTSYSKFGLRDVKDATNSAPTWSNSAQRYINYQGTADANKPKLVITYRVPSGNFVPFL